MQAYCILHSGTSSLLCQGHKHYKNVLVLPEEGCTLGEDILQDCDLHSSSWCSPLLSHLKVRVRDEYSKCVLLCLFV